MLYQRDLAKTLDFIRFLMPDSSPQLKFNYLCTKEERFRFPPDLPLVDRKHDELAKHFESRALATTTLGYGPLTGIHRGG